MRKKIPIIILFFRFKISAIRIFMIYIFILSTTMSCDKKYLAKDNVIYLGRVYINYDSNMKIEAEFRADDSNKDKKGYKFILINDSLSFVIHYNYDKRRKEITGYFYGEFNTMRFLKGEKIGEDFIFEIIDQNSPGTTYLQFGSIYLTPKK